MSSGRLRRDLRSGLNVAAQHGNRLRIRRNANGATASVTPTAEARLPATSPLVIERIAEPAYQILAVPDCLENRFSVHDREMMGMARQLADKDGGAVCMLCFSEPASDPGAVGADRLLVIPEDRAAYCPDTDAGWLCSAISDLQPRHVLFPDSQERGGDLGRRVASMLKATVATAVWQADLKHCTRLAKCGRESIRMPTPFVILAAAGSCPPVQGTYHEARPIAAGSAEKQKSAFLSTEVSIPPPAEVPLAEAEFILAAGDGLRDWDTYHALAAKLGATEGGSRVVVDKGFLPAHRQVGSTGTITNARTYIALGISGAPQHLQGIADCENVVAINTDGNCHMMKRADLAVVGSTQEIMQALLQSLGEENG